MRAGDTAKGTTYLERLEGTAPPAQMHLLRGFAHYRQKEYADAQRELESAVRLAPDSAAALAALGRLHLRINDDALAIRYFEQALQRAPQDAESRYQLGVLLDRNGQAGRARQELTRAISLRANYPDPMYALAKIELKQSRPEQALGLLRKAVKLAPEQEAIHLLLARTHQARSDRMSRPRPNSPKCDGYRR